MPNIFLIMDHMQKFHWYWLFNLTKSGCLKKKRILLLLQHTELIPCGDVCGLNLSTNVIDEASHILTSSPDEANLRFSCMTAPANSLKQHILKTIKDRF